MQDIDSARLRLGLAANKLGTRCWEDRAQNIDRHVPYVQYLIIRNSREFVDSRSPGKHVYGDGK